MMSDIFTSFDPATMHLSSACTSIPNFSMIFLFTPTIWFTPNFLLLLSLYSASLIWTQLSQTLSLRLKGTPSLLPALFSLLIFLNLLGLAPYIFATTSHLMITASLGLPLWLCLIISSITLNPYMFLASLLPSGAPSWLNPFLNLVETTSMNLRPLTLSFRLAANMTAGHIVLALMSTYLSYNFLLKNLVLTLLTFCLQLSYVCFEMVICLIQAFIFSLLLSLYSNEHTLI